MFSKPHLSHSPECYSPHIRPPPSPQRNPTPPTKTQRAPWSPQRKQKHLRQKNKTCNLKPLKKRKQTPSQTLHVCHLCRPINPPGTPGLAVRSRKDRQGSLGAPWSSDLSGMALSLAATLLGKDRSRLLRHHDHGGAATEATSRTRRKAHRDLAPVLCGRSPCGVRSISCTSFFSSRPFCDLFPGLRSDRTNQGIK